MKYPLNWACKEDVDSTTTIIEHTTRTKHICGEKYGGILTFSTTSGNWDLGNKTYFEPMIKNEKVK